MENMAYYADRLPCGDEEKRACLETVRALTQAMYIVRREGILVLDYLLEDQEDRLPALWDRLSELDALRKKLRGPFFRACAEELVNGEERGTRSRLETILIAGNYRGGSFLENVLTVEGFLLIQKGEYKNTLANALHPWFGAGWRATVFDTVNDEWDRIYVPMNHYKTFKVEFQDKRHATLTAVEGITEDMGVPKVLSYNGDEINWFYTEPNPGELEGTMLSPDFFEVNGETYVILKEMDYNSAIGRIVKFSYESDGEDRPADPGILGSFTYIF